MPEAGDCIKELCSKTWNMLLLKWHKIRMWNTETNILRIVANWVIMPLTILHLLGFEYNFNEHCLNLTAKKIVCKIFPNLCWIKF